MVKRGRQMVDREFYWHKGLDFIAHPSEMCTFIGQFSLIMQHAHDSLIEDVQALEQRLAAPTPALVEAMKQLGGDLLLLGAGGKMGPSLARLAVNALRQAHQPNRVIAVSRFSNPATREALEQDGVHTLAADLLEEDQLAALPAAPNVLYLAGTKFGTQGNEALTWAMNSYLPGRVAEKYKDSRIVVFSTGNVYPLTPVTSGGADESTPPAPVGEYAQSCLGRERVFSYFSRKYQTPILIYRLNYAIDLRYGVLLDVAQAVWAGRPVNLNMGFVNVIWQGDANAVALRSLLYCTCPPAILNVTGPETVSVAWLARQFAQRMGKDLTFEGAPGDTALLSHASRAHQWMGYPTVGLQTLVDWVAHWVMTEKEILGKPTHFQEREGRF